MDPDGATEIDKGRYMRKHISRITLAALLATAPMQAQAKNEKAWATASDFGVAGLSLAALGLPIAQGDTQGAFQAAGSLGASALITTGLKYTFPELRPDGSDRKSFPSGHTSTAFAAAATLYNRQGADIGVPAMLAASFVGLARVQADKHHWYDVVVGAGIGSASGFLITRKRSQREALVLPWGDSKSAGVSVAMRF
jgi:membrane-associated phospholipid phosphatase